MKHAIRELIHPELYHKISKLDLFNEFEELYHLNSHQAFTIATKSLQLPEVFSKIPGNLCQCCSAISKWDFSTTLIKIPIYKEFDMGFTTFRHCSALKGAQLVYLLINLLLVLEVAMRQLILSNDSKNQTGINSTDAIFAFQFN